MQPEPGPPELTEISQAEPATPPAAQTTLEFELDAADIPRLLRAPALATLRAGSTRTTAIHAVWHDTADNALASAGLALCQAGAAAARPGSWSLERLTPDSALEWLPATPAHVLAQAAAPDQLGQDLPGPLAHAAAFAGRQSSLPLAFPGGPGRLTILSGTLRGVALDQPASRMRLAGPTADIVALVPRLAEAVRLVPPHASLAAAALALARGRATPPRQTGAPKLPRGLDADAALACITGHLADVTLHWAVLVPAATTPEPVHQARVAVRRLRSALTVFRRAAAEHAGSTAWLDTLASTLRDLASRLGAARDWDVFLTETGASVLDAFPQDRRVAQLLAAATRRRAAAYADLATYFASRDWTRLSITLALLPTARPWNDAGLLSQPVQITATQALDRRLKHTLEPGSDLSGLTPPQLHDIRKQAKRLRYATEFFAPLFSDKAVRKYLPRLQDLQEVLGAVNDTDVAAGLMAQLAGGSDRAFAAGVVAGFGAARAARAAKRVQRSWERFIRADPFWD